MHHGRDEAGKNVEETRAARQHEERERREKSKPEEERKGKSGAIRARAAKKKKNKPRPRRGLDPVPRRVPTRFSAIKPRARLLGFSPETFARRIKATLFTARQTARFPRRGREEEGVSRREREYGLLSRG